LALHRLGNLSDYEISALLVIHSRGCGRTVFDREIGDAVASAKLLVSEADVTGPDYYWSQSSPPRPKWPAMDPVFRADAIANSAFKDLVEMRAHSPVPCSCHAGDAENYVDALFPGNRLLCVGLSKHDFTTAPRESFRGRLPAAKTALQLLQAGTLILRFRTAHYPHASCASTSRPWKTAASSRSKPSVPGIGTAISGK
jgi:hypothetical protein